MELPDLDNLTPREHEVLGYVGDGLSLLEIAQKLSRSLKTIESHRLSLGRKLDVNNRVELAKIAIAHGLTKLPHSTEPSVVTQNPPPAYRRVINDQPRAARLADAITDRVFDRAGANYLRHLCNALCDCLEVRYAGVSTEGLGHDGQEVFQSLACSRSGHPVDLLAYLRDGSVCQHAIDQGHLTVASNVIEAYPRDHFLSEKLIESYAGVAITHHCGESLGVLWVMHDADLVDGQAIELVLRYFEPSVAATVEEIQRAQHLLHLCEERGDALEQANRELEHHNDRLDKVASYYSELAERMTDGLIVIDQGWRIKYANDKFATIANRSRSNLIGTKVESLLSDDSMEHFRAMQENRETDEMSHYKACLKLADGTEREILVAPRTLFDDDGLFAGSFAVITDLADLNRAKQSTEMNCEA